LHDGNDKELIAGGKKLIELYNEDLEPSFFEELVHFAIYFRNCNAVKSSSSKQDTTSMKLEAFQYLIPNELAEVFPNGLIIAYRIYLSLMITNCSGERSFSKLRRLKSCMRSTMGQKRLDSLVILYVEHALARKIKHDKIISDFADKMSPRSSTYATGC